MAQIPSPKKIAPDGETKARVAELLGKGYPPREIARELNISHAAVYQHMAKLREEAEAAS